MSLTSAGNPSSNAGTYSIAAAQGSLTFNPAYSAFTIDYVPGTLTVLKAPLAITADNQSRLFAAANPALTGSISGFVNGQNASVLALPRPSYSTTATLNSSLGFYPITASGALAANYSFTYQSGELDISGFAPIPTTVQNTLSSFAVASAPAAPQPIMAQPVATSSNPESTQPSSPSLRPKIYSPHATTPGIEQPAHLLRQADAVSLWSAAGAVNASNRAALAVQVPDSVAKRLAASACSQRT